MSNKIESMASIANIDKDIIAKNTAPTIYGKVRISVMPEKLLFFTTEEKYISLSKMLIKKFKRSIIKREN